MSVQFDGSDTVAWCSTATYSDGSHVADVGAWGECADTCAACQVRVETRGH